MQARCDGVMDKNHLHLCFCRLQSAPNCLLTTPLFGIAFHCRTARKSLGRNPSGRGTGRGNLGKITCQKTIVHCATHCRLRPLRPAAHSLPFAEKSRRCASSLHPRPSNTIEPCLAMAGLRGNIGSGLGGRGRIADGLDRADLLCFLFLKLDISNYLH